MSNLDVKVLNDEIKDAMVPKERKHFIQRKTNVSGDSDKNTFIKKFSEDVSEDFNTDFLKEK